MLMAVSELRQYIQTDETDQMLEAKLTALEQAIRSYTNNNFQHRGYRSWADLAGGVLKMNPFQPFRTGDTVQITGSHRNNGLYTVTETSEYTATLSGETVDELEILVTKVVYPMDIKLGAVNLLKWDMEQRGKVGVASETISRHSVTYVDMTADNTIMGYPASLMGFLRPYCKARFGGVSV